MQGLQNADNNVILLCCHLQQFILEQGVHLQARFIVIYTKEFDYITLYRLKVNAF